MLKKNIAKLLVFAMILSMLPFSMVTAGAEGAQTGETAKLSDYVTISDVKVGNYTLTRDTSDFSYKMGNDVVSGKVTVEFKATIKGGAKGLGIKYGDKTLDKTGSNGYSLSGDTIYTVKYDVTIKESDTGTQTETFALTAVNGETTLATGNVVLTLNVPETEEPPVNDGESVYRIKLDATATVTIGTPKKLTATLEYRIASDATAPYTTGDDTTFTWSSSNTGVATVASDGTVTGVTEGTATITASCNVGGKTVEAECAVTVEAGSGQEETYTVTMAAMENGTVGVKDVTPNADKTYTIEKGAKVILLVDPDEGYKLSEDTLTYKLANDATAKRVLLDADNAYSFTMPDCNVTITAEFELAETAILIDEVPITLDLEGVVEGYALRDATTSADGVTLETTWTDEADEILSKTFVSGLNKFAISVTADEGYKLADDVRYTLNGSDPARLTDNVVTGEKTLAGRVRGAEWNAVPGRTLGELEIRGISAEKWYLVQVKKVDRTSNVPTSAYIILEGGANGTLNVPCEFGVTLNLTELDSANNLSGRTFVQEAKIEGNGDLPTREVNEDVRSAASLENNTDIVKFADTKSARTGDLSAEWNSVEGRTLGELVISGVSDQKWYLVQVKKVNRTSNVPTSAYIILEGRANGTLNVPCEFGVTLNLTELDSADNLSGHTFVQEAKIKGNGDLPLKGADENEA